MLRLTRLIGKCSDLSGKVLAISVVLIAVILSYEVVMRYIFNDPTQWAHELSGLLYTASFFSGGAYVLRHKAHVSVDILSNRLSPRGRAITDIITAVIVLSLCGIFLYYGSLLAWKALIRLETSHTPWGPPLGPVKLFLVLGAFMLALQALAKLTQDVYTAIRGRETV